MGLVVCKPCCDCMSCDEVLSLPRLRRRIRTPSGTDAPEDGGYVSLDGDGRVLGGSSSPRPCNTSASGRGAAEEKMKGFFMNRRPPSVEDEKQYMRVSLRNILEQQEAAPKECLLCMEGFTESNPEVRTLCRCGENRNNYHSHCLVRWRRRSGKTSCPVCDQELFFEVEEGGLGFSPSSLTLGGSSSAASSLGAESLRSRDL